jgi:hypothetical protein
VGQFGTVDWEAIAAQISGRTDIQCRQHWSKVLDPDISHAPWTSAEDQIIIDFVEKNGPGDWAKLAKRLLGRTDQQCQKRWFKDLDPDINHAPLTPDEDQQLSDLVARFGRHWTIIASFMPNRNADQIRSHWDNYLALRLALRASVSHAQSSPNPQDDTSTQNDDDSPPPMAQPLPQQNPPSQVLQLRPPPSQPPPQRPPSPNPELLFQDSFPNFGTGDFTFLDPNNQDNFFFDLKMIQSIDSNNKMAMRLLSPF